jgi:hypothetical protein
MSIDSFDINEIKMMGEVFRLGISALRESRALEKQQFACDHRKT